MASGLKHEVIPEDAPKLEPPERVKRFKRSTHEKHSEPNQELQEEKPTSPPQVNVECTRCFKWMKLGQLPNGMFAYKCESCGQVMAVKILE